MNFAVIFPGQGSQKVGMGLDLFEESNTYLEKAKDLFKKADELTSSNLSNIFLFGPENELNQTKNTQPAIVTISIALTLLLREELKKKKFDFKPIATCGHSLGEFTSLWFLDILSTEEVIKLVSTRGNLMQNSTNGGMAAILNLSLEQIEGLRNKLEKYKNEITIANHNTPSQYVVSGKKEYITNFTNEAKQLGGKAIILPVSGAFHSKLMESPSNLFQQEIDKLQIFKRKSPSIPIYQNIDGKPSKDINVIYEKVKKQMTSSVFWTQTINNLVNDNVKAVIEIGPGNVLCGLVKKINPNLDCYNISDYLSLKEFIKTYEHKFLRNGSQKVT